MLEKLVIKKDTVTTGWGAQVQNNLSQPIINRLGGVNRNYRKGNYAGGKWYTAFTIYFLME